MSGEQINQRCSKCLEGCRGFLTDREKRKLFGMGVSLGVNKEPCCIPTLQVLYLVGFPILIVMIVVGALKAAPPGEENPACPAEPNMPWFLVTGGAGISVLLIIRIILNKLTNYVKNNQECCDQVSPGYLTTKLYHTIPRLLAVSASLAVTWCTTSW